MALPFCLKLFLLTSPYISMCLWLIWRNYMLLRVIYSDGKYDLVNSDLLASLIESNGIIRFKRFDG
jgi:hypothetical protein